MNTLWHRVLHGVALLTALAVFTLVGFATVRMVGPDAAPIRWVEVAGPFERVSADQVRLAAAAVARTGFFSLEPELVRARVAEIPWVSAVEVSKRWPDTVIIKVYEHRPLARFGADRLVSASGDLFRVDGDSAIAGLPHFEGDPDYALEMIEFYHRAGELLTATGLEISHLKRSDRGAWRMRLADAVDIELGSEKPLERFALLTASLDQLGSNVRERVAAIDLRYGNGFAVRWEEPETPELIPASMTADGRSP